MNINRNNYETFFLLYVDNELSDIERKEVEAFLEQNPDLQTEMDMFMEVVLQPEPAIVFPSKQMLFRGHNPVNSDNYEMYFVMYGDNELNESDRRYVEQFVQEHPQFSTEFELIQSARVTPDLSVVFEGKEVLYRHEKPAGRVITMQWMRAVAAAVAFVFMVGTAWIFINDSNSDKNLVALEDTNRTSHTTKEPSNTAATKKSTTPVVKQQQEPMVEGGSENKETDRASNNTDISSQAKGRIQSDKRQIDTKNISPAGNNSATQIVQSLKQPEIADNDVDPRELAANQRIEETRRPVIDEAIGEEELIARSNGKASARSANISEPVNENVTFVSNTSGNKKNILRGFFRKATRVLEKTTNIDPSNNDKNLHIAGFEIALK